MVEIQVFQELIACREHEILRGNNQVGYPMKNRKMCRLFSLKAPNSYQSKVDMVKCLTEFVAHYNDKLEIIFRKGFPFSSFKIGSGSGFIIFFLFLRSGYTGCSTYRTGIRSENFFLDFRRTRRRVDSSDFSPRN